MAGNITGRHLAGTVLMGSPVAELIYFPIRLERIPGTYCCASLLIKTFETCPLSNGPNFHLFRTDAVHGCPKGLADYNLNSILLLSIANVYHYPSLVIMAESQPRLCFKYKGSLEAGTDTA